MNSDINLLREIKETIEVGKNGVESILCKVKCIEFEKELRQELDFYKEQEIKVNNYLAIDNNPDKEIKMCKTFQRMLVKMNTLFDCSTTHLAELMINGTVMGIINITRTYKDDECHIMEEYKEYTKTFIKTLTDFEMKLRDFL
jgi:hypothetical protein